VNSPIFPALLMFLQKVMKYYKYFINALLMYIVVANNVTLKCI